MLKVWDERSLLELIREKLSDTVFTVVSNRQPYIYTYKKGKVQWQRGPGGIITALDPVMRRIKGLWVASSSGEADLEAAGNSNKVAVPPDDPAYRLRYVRLSREEETGYYLGFANQALWPLMHQVYVRPLFDARHWQIYKKVNRKFAAAVYQEIRSERALVFFQDYHLSLAASFLKELKPEVKTLLFWHIPWPAYDLFRVFPWKQELLKGLLANDLIGFHLSDFCRNFFAAVSNELESRVSRESASLVVSGHTTLVRSYPISVDYTGIDKSASGPEVRYAAEALKKEFFLADYRLIAGLDRIDYTKGIPERIRAYDLLLEDHPELREKIIFVQIGEISRIRIAAYRKLNDRIKNMIDTVNNKYGNSRWQPVLFLKRHLSFSELLAFYCLADVCLVTSLHDGMNLVAKEFVSARRDDQGVLVLSRFTGAVRELKTSLQVNPFSVREIKAALYQALTMDGGEISSRMKKMRSVVSRNNIWKWTADIISDAAAL